MSEFSICEEVCAFGRDNTHFGSVERKGENNIFKKHENKLNRSLIGVGCPVRVLHNAIQSGTDILYYHKTYKNNY